MDNPKTLFMNVSEVADKCGVSKASAYKIIKKLNVDLGKMHKLVQNGRIQRIFFYSRIYGSMEENLKEDKLFITASEMSEKCGIPVNTLYPKIRKSNQELKKEGYVVFCGRLPKAYFNHHWIFEEKDLRN